MGVEEQKEEREVLDSIFPDEITDISESSYRVAIKLDVDPDEAAPNANDDADSSSSSGDNNSLTLLLQVSYPPTYPDVAPDLTLSAPPSHHPSNYPYLSVATDGPLLLSNLADTVTENLGMAMVFTLVSTLKEAAEDLIAARKAAHQKRQDEAAARAEEEENRKFAGEAVTRESFMAWREKFRAEMSRRTELEKEEERKAADGRGKSGGGGGGGGGREDHQKLTGRQLWERGMVGKTEEDVDVDEREEEAHETPGNDVRDGLANLKIAA
ncbi:MAG: hypothetical protein M1838_000648 [Thelocarpon superellum]|nr:MAG: hypothetical protein M1838_000648 [Thelocarpon superellum]